ncbi:NADH dehydrogenase-like protein YjlD [Stieleria neptunia]|uniref:NADH dehydrogenase-like protein YjlD n=1 Tax=Stieleria neptunia TaxID=2527979 RepID=A0A518HLN3_9BACT|nr:FAD-dependent oxidoreductase [Stieleria neptunia]QDV41753.1 NADH dehydrogenase-like protein YjlD [Stieleria neptunia]
MNPAPANGPLKNIVLLGIGHTNAHLVKQWISEPIAGCRLICISKFPTATYSGMLPGTLGQQFSDDEMRIDLAALAHHAGADLVIADTQGIDLDAGQLHFCDHDPISFDVLSIGVGSMPAGWEQHSHSKLLVPIKPMQTFLQRLESHLRDQAVNQSPDERDPIRVAVVGGGVASVEIAFCLQQQWQKRRNEREIAIEIFTSSRHVADGMPMRSVRSIEKLLGQRGITVHRGQRVDALTDTTLHTDDGRSHRSDCVIWATGAAAPAVLGRLGLQTDERGFIATSKTLQSLSDERIFAVGDSGTVIESPSPKAGVYAVRQCPVLWHNVNALLNQDALHRFEPQRDFLKLLNTGDGKAMLQYGWFTAHARWCWRLKTWIDKRFVREYQFHSDFHGRSNTQTTDDLSEEPLSCR